MQNRGKTIDMLYDHLMSLASSSGYAFGSLRSDWGYSNSVQYNDKKTLFVTSIVRLAKDCSIKSWNGDFYFFTGKIYEYVDKTMIEMAYENMILSLAIAPMMNKSTIRRENFLNVILSYNEITPRLDMVCFNNGVLDLSVPTKPVLRDFSLEYPVMYYRPYDYDDKARCDRWHLFLREVLPDKAARTILQMFLGLGLMQRNVAFDDRNRTDGGKVELCLLLVGSGANGKSVIFEVMRALFGDDKISKVDYDTLLAPGDEGLRGRVPIRGATFNWSSDSNPKKFGKGRTDIFKRLVSGEPIQDRRLGEDIMTNTNIPYLIFNLNALPDTNDDTNGFMRRLQIIPFDVTIPRSKRDPNLANRIIKDELAGVFNWVMRGTKELVRRRFRFPDAEGSRLALLRTLIQSSPVMAWIRTYNIRCDKEAPNEVPVYISGNDLYREFVRFCKDNDVDENIIPSINRFGRDMRDKAGFFKKRTGNGVYYETYGVTLEKLHNPIFVTDIQELEEDEFDGVESFIKDDD